MLGNRLSIVSVKEFSRAFTLSDVGIKRLIE